MARGRRKDIGAATDPQDAERRADDPEVAAVREDLELGQFIPLHYHFNMLNDAHRTGAFEEAIAHAVPEGGRVVDLGGGTGVLSFFAARKAERVWCVERNPELADTARRLLRANGADAVEVVVADAREFLPPEPVDVVVCEMLHVGLLREKQIEVIDAFKANYRRRFAERLPRFVPEATVQAVQPLCQDFAFHGYEAPVPFFQEPHAPQPRTTELGPPQVYGSFLYEDLLHHEITWRGGLQIERDGVLNALRIVTKNLLAIVPTQGRSIDWLMNYLVVPLERPRRVEAGETVELSLAYEAGAPISALRPFFPA